MGRGGAHPQLVHLRRGRPDREPRARPRHEGPRPHARLALPAAELGLRPRRDGSARGDEQPHHPGDDPLQGQDPLLGRGQRGVPGRRQRRPAQLAVPGQARRRLHRGGVPHGPGGRPERQALLQRLQHRRRQREEQCRLRHGPGLQVPWRADRLRGLPVPLQQRLPGPRRLPGQPPALRRPRRRGADHRAGHRGLGHGPGDQLRQCRTGLPRGDPLHRHHGVGHPGQVLVAGQRDTTPLRRQLQQEARVPRRPERPRRLHRPGRPRHPGHDLHRHLQHGGGLGQRLQRQGDHHGGQFTDHRVEREGHDDTPAKNRGRLERRRHLGHHRQTS